MSTQESVAVFGGGMARKVSTSAHDSRRKPDPRVGPGLVAKLADHLTQITRRRSATRAKDWRRSSLRQTMKFSIFGNMIGPYHNLPSAMQRSTNALGRIAMPRSKAV